jgi:hypothetical protein
MFHLRSRVKADVDHPLGVCWSELSCLTEGESTNLLDLYLLWFLYVFARLCKLFCLKVNLVIEKKGCTFVLLSHCFCLIWICLSLTVVVKIHLWIVAIVFWSMSVREVANKYESSESVCFAIYIVVQPGVAMSVAVELLCCLIRHVSDCIDVFTLYKTLSI